jgi:small-conductance mechanosensitive channel
LKSIFPKIGARSSGFSGNRRRWWILALCLPLVPTFGVPENAPTARDQQEIIDFLNRSIEWYQRSESLERIATGPADTFFVNSNRPVAEQIVRLSFDFARAKAAIVGESQATAAIKSPVDSRYYNLSQNFAQLNSQAQKLQAELESLRKQQQSAPASQRKSLASAVAKTQSQLTLMQTRQNAIHNILEFMGGSSGVDNLAAQTDALERAIPKPPEGGSAQAGGTSTGKSKDDSGLWALFIRILEVSRKLQTVNGSIRQTNQLSQDIKDITVPLRHQLGELVKESEANVSQTGALDPAVLAQQKAALDSTNDQFKAVAAVLLPLSKEGILINSYQSTLQDWHSSIESEYGSLIKGLILRLLILGIIVGIVLGVFKLWRRAIIRYIPDLSKRYQFLVMRKITLGIVVGFILLLAFASQLGSLATFAGLMTAGLAVALQNLFLAIAGYFILIGKYGVRAGDRVQIADIKGQVVEIGILRLQILEVSGMDGDAQPTGRIVGLSNSVVFQPLSGFFKQVPGASLIWREINFTVARESDYHVVEQLTFDAVNSAFADYQADLEKLRSKMESIVESVSIGSLQPKIRVRMTQIGIEVNIRFPTELRRAAEISDRITKSLLRAIEAEPQLKVIEAEAPAVRSGSRASKSAVTSRT